MILTSTSLSQWKLIGVHNLSVCLSQYMYSDVWITAGIEMSINMSKESV